MNRLIGDHGCQEGDSGMKSRRMFRTVSVALIASAAIMLSGCGSSSSFAPRGGTTVRAGTAQRFTGIHMITAKQGWAVNGYRIFRTNDAGVSWTNVSPAHFEEGSIRTDFLNANTAYAVSVPFGNLKRTEVLINRTSNGGRKWQSTRFYVLRAKSKGGVPLPPPLVSYVDFINPQAGWISLIDPANTGGGPTPGEVWVTKDGGVQWRPAQLHSSIGGSAYFLNSRTGWLFDSTGAVGIAPGETYSFVTRDGGGEWKHQSLPVLPSLSMDSQTVFYVRVWPTSQAVVLMEYASSRWVTYSTVDSGSKWRASTPATISGQQGAAFYVSPTRGWLLVGGVLYRTMDGGNRWTAVNRSLKNVQTLDFVNQQIGFALSARKLLYTKNGGAVWSQR